MSDTFLLFLTISLIKGGLFYCLVQLNKHYKWLVNLHEKYAIVLVLLALLMFPMGGFSLAKNAKQTWPEQSIAAFAAVQSTELAPAESAPDINVVMTEATPKHKIICPLKYWWWGYGIIAGVILWFKLTRLIYAGIFLRKLPQITEPQCLAATLPNVPPQVELYCGDTISNSPAGGGIFRKMILLPQKRLQGYSITEISWLVAHEKAHFYYGDNLVKVFFYLVGAIYWFNPFFALLRNELFNLMELRCDAKVIKDFAMNKTGKTTYLKILTDFAFSGSLLLANELGGNAKNLKSRLEAIMQESTVLKGRKIRCSTIIICGMIIAAIMPTFGSEDDIQASSAARTIIAKAEAQLNHNNLSISNTVFMGQVSSSMHTFDTENYPANSGRFEYFDDATVQYLAIPLNQIISDYQSVWFNMNRASVGTLVSNNLNGIKNNSNASNFFRLPAGSSAVAWLNPWRQLKQLANATSISITKTDNEIILTDALPPQTEYIFNKDYLLQRITRHGLKWEYFDYKDYNGVLVPSRIITTITAPFFTQITTYMITEFRINDATINAPSLPQKSQDLPQNVVKSGTFEWREISTMSRNLTAMQKIYGKDMLFGVYVAMSEQHSNQTETIIQLTFSSSAIAAEFLKQAADNANIATVWQIGSNVQFIEAPLTETKQELAKALLQNKTIFLPQSVETILKIHNTDIP